MSQALSGTIKKTPLNARHRSLGGRMVEYGGWDMPVEYSGIIDEHQGTIRVQNRPEGGACFTIRPPGRPAEANHGHVAGR